MVKPLLAVIKFLSLLILMGLFTACGGGSSDSTSSSVSPAQEIENDTVNDNVDETLFHSLDINRMKFDKVVCDPMGGNGNPSIYDGVIAELYSLDHRLHQHSSVQDYFDKGTRSSQKLFFSGINVPTQFFDKGFSSETGSAVKDDQGAVLVNNFAMRMKTVLALGPNDEEGDYEFALLADDGAVLKFINIDGDQEVIVDNDGMHPTRFGCGNQTVSMDKKTSIDVRLEYFQGADHHITLIPMWRKVDSSTQKEKECGKQGNGRYFKFNQNSEPQKKYLGLLENGWKPIADENWKLPNSSIFNPCNDGTNVVINDYKVTKVGEMAVEVTWSTDQPATSQVIVRDALGNEWMTQTNNTLVKEHRVLIDQNLQDGQTYNFQAFSVSSDLGKTLSRVLPITF